MVSRLKLAIVTDGRLAWKIARAAGLSATQISHLCTGVRAARAEEKKRLALVLGVDERELFPPDEVFP